MKTQLIIGAALSALLCAHPAAAQVDTLDEVIVTATRAPQGIEASRIAGSATLITPADFEDRQVRAISDTLRDVPGVSVGRTGGPGAFTQIRIRGAEANHTLVLIDGVEVGNPFAGEFDFGTLIADDAGRIEVLRGQQSALYGSDAIGGVVHYITPTGRELSGLRASVEGGSNDTLNGAVRYAGVSGDFDYALNAGFQTTEGYVVAPGGSEDVGATQRTVSAKLGYRLSDALTLKAVLRQNNTSADQVNEVFFPVYGVLDGPGYVAEAATTYALIGADHVSLDGAWTNSLSLQGMSADRDLYTAFARSGGDKASRLKASYVSAYHLQSGDLDHAFTVAVDAERESFQNTAAPDPFGPDTTRRHVENLGLVGQYRLDIAKRAGVGASVRQDSNSDFDDATTWRLDGYYRLSDTVRLRGAAGTGIKNPGQTELFGYNAASFPFVGNPDLKPETSKGWEAGVDFILLDGKATAGATYFDSELTDEIYTDFSVSPSTARNRTTDSLQKGVELFASATLTDAWRIDAAYTYLDATNAGVEVIRRAPNSGSVNLAWREPAGRFGAGITARYVGDATDTDFGTGATVTLPSFTLVNLTGFWNVTEKAQVFGRIENLLDEDYQEVVNYQTSGVTAYLGVRKSF